MLRNVNRLLLSELDSFLKELRDKRGHTDETLSTRETALNLFFDWLGKQELSLKDMSPATIDAYFVQNRASSWKKSNLCCTFSGPCQRLVQRPKHGTIKQDGSSPSPSIGLDSWASGLIRSAIPSSSPYAPFYAMPADAAGAPGLAETIKGPKIYSMAGLPEGPSWEQTSVWLPISTQRIRVKFATVQSFCSWRYKVCV